MKNMIFTMISFFDKPQRNFKNDNYQPKQKNRKVHLKLRQFFYFSTKYGLILLISVILHSFSKQIKK